MKNKASTTNAKPGRPEKSLAIPAKRFTISGLFNQRNPKGKPQRIARVTIAAKVKEWLKQGKVSVVETRNEGGRKGRPTNVFLVKGKEVAS